MRCCLCVLSVLASGCVTVTAQQIPLVLLADVPVPEGARSENDHEGEIGRDSGGGLLFLAAESDAAGAVWESLDPARVDTAADGNRYYEGTESRFLLPLLLFFYESTTFRGKAVSLSAKPLPRDEGIFVGAASSPGPEVDAHERSPKPATATAVDPVGVEEPEVEPPPADTSVTEAEAEADAGVEALAEEPAPKKKQRKKRKGRKKRRRRGHRP